MTFPQNKHVYAFFSDLDQLAYYFAIMREKEPKSLEDVSVYMPYNYTIYINCYRSFLMAVVSTGSSSPMTGLHISLCM